MHKLAVHSHFSGKLGWRDVRVVRVEHVWRGWQDGSFRYRQPCGSQLLPRISAVLRHAK